MVKPYILHLGNCLDTLKTYLDNSIDSIVTDPPYGISFMSKKWDYDVPSVEIWQECLRVLKPGGYLLCFASTRTQHRMAVNIEDAGFTIKDCITWVYSSGFPKSHNVSCAIDKSFGHPNRGRAIPTASTYQASDVDKENKLTSNEVAPYEPITDEAKAWQGWGTALKPACEPITVAQKPIKGTIASNVLEWGTGAINVDATRVPIDEDDFAKLSAGVEKIRERGGVMDNSWKNSSDLSGANPANPLGRWGANFIHDGSQEVLDLFPDIGKTNNSTARFFAYFPPESSYNRLWQDQNLNQSTAPTVESLLSPQKALEDIVQKVVANTASLEAMQSSEWTGHFTNATQSELKLTENLITAVMWIIENECLQGLQLEKRTPSNNLVNVAVMKKQTGITTITINLQTLDGSVENAIFNITQKSWEPGVLGYRFKYCSKANKKDRNEGLEGLEPKQYSHDGREVRNETAYQRNDSVAANHHPTVKPTDIMCYLVRMVTRKGCTVLDPFMGSGTTGKAAMREGMNFIGCELDAEYLAIAEKRIQYELDKRA